MNCCLWVNLFINIILIFPKKIRLSDKIIFYIISYKYYLQIEDIECIRCSKVHQSVIKVVCLWSELWQHQLKWAGDKIWKRKTQIRRREETERAGGKEGEGAEGGVNMGGREGGLCGCACRREHVLGCVRGRNCKLDEVSHLCTER